MTVTAVIIAKNEEDKIRECLRSVSFCDEILLIDGGSRDKTNDIAKKFGAKIVPSYENDFAKARNVGLKHARSEYLLYVDADERVSKELMIAVKQIVYKKSTPFCAYRLQRKNFYVGDHEWPMIEHLERLFVKKDLKKWYGKLHESPKVAGEIGSISSGFLLHFTHRNLSEMLTKTLAWSETEATLRLRVHHPQVTWWRFPRVMLGSFYASYIKQKGYSVGTAGLVESIYQAFSSFVTYARLWEMQHKRES